MAALVCRNCFRGVLCGRVSIRKIRTICLIPFFGQGTLSLHWFLFAFPTIRIRLLAAVHSRQQTLLVQVVELSTATKKVAPYKGFSRINRRLVCRFQRTIYGLLRFGRKTTRKFFFKSAFFFLTHPKRHINTNPTPPNTKTLAA